MRIALVVPHIFMHRNILPQVIFSPGTLALDLAASLAADGVDVTLCTPGPVNTPVANLTADMSAFEQVLRERETTYTELLKDHSFTFVTLARQVQSELIAYVFKRANAGEFDIVHIYTNEEDIALPFIQFCTRPVVLTHHDPFNFLLKYRTIFPKYNHLHWLSMSHAQRSAMPPDTNWAGNIYHGLPADQYVPVARPTGNYVTYLGRIIKSKGVHLAIEAVQQYNRAHPEAPLKLKIAGKHYSGQKDAYWQRHIAPQIDGDTVEYVGFLRSTEEKQNLLGNARALLVPSLFDEPFGMVMIEALACGTPVIGLRSGAIPEVITDQKTGFLIDAPQPKAAAHKTVTALADALKKVETISRKDCRAEFEARFTLARMAAEHKAVYASLL